MRERAYYFSFKRFKNDQLLGLPPASLQIAEAGILRDEGEAYGHRLDLAGVKATTISYIVTIHDFGLLNQLADTSQSK